MDAADSYKSYLKKLGWTTVLVKLVMATIILTYLLTQTPFEVFALAIVYTILMGLSIILNFTWSFFMRSNGDMAAWNSRFGYMYYMFALILDYIIFVSWYFRLLDNHSVFRKHPDHNKIPHSDDPAFYTYQGLNIVFVVTTIFFVMMAFTFLYGETDRTDSSFHYDIGVTLSSQLAMKVSVGMGCAAFFVIMFNGLFSFWVIIGFDAGPLWMYLFFWALASALIICSSVAYFFFSEAIDPATDARSSVMKYFRGHWKAFNVIQACLFIWWAFNFAFWIRVWSSHHGSKHSLREKVQFDGTLALQPYFLYTYYAFLNINAATGAFAVYYLVTLVCSARMAFAGKESAEVRANSSERLLVGGHSVAYNFGAVQWAYFVIYTLSFLYDILVAGFTLSELQEHFFLSNHFHEWIISYVTISGAFNLACFIIAMLRLFVGKTELGEQTRCLVLRTTLANMYILVTVGFAYFWIHARFSDADFLHVNLRAANSKNAEIYWNVMVYVFLVTILKIIMYVDVYGSLSTMIVQKAGGPIPVLSAVKAAIDNTARNLFAAPSQQKLI